MIKEYINRIKNKLAEILVVLKGNESRIVQVNKKLDALSLQTGAYQSQQLKMRGRLSSIHDAEFKVFSQWGDDGIMQYLVSYLDVPNEVFIEFGVEDYRESNTRFLLLNNNWSGLVLDGSTSHINGIQKQDIYWKYDLKAKQSFITAENINQLIAEEGITGEIGILHIDIDGNDYWIWKALSVVEPVIMIVEYNSVFGKERAITVPYKADFVRNAAHYSHLYAGASLMALCDLAATKGYHFVGSNSAGNNAYFIKKGFEKDIPILNIEDGYVESKFRESRNQEGDLTYLRGNDRIEALRGLTVFNTRTNNLEEI